MTRASTYGPRTTKRRRRTKADIEALRTALHEILIEGAPMSVRQVYYQATTRGLVEKTQAQYRAILRQLVLMRQSGRVGYGMIADNTRWMRRPRTFGSVEDALWQTARVYRREVWADLGVRVEVWLEKEALSGVLYQTTEVWDVPLMVTRGYSSLSFLHGAAEQIRANECPTFIYYFGDHDPSGEDIARHVERSLREFAPEVELEFERVAVTEQQIEELNLPTRPTKKSDVRAKGFRGESVEVDAIHPTKLRELAENCIAQHVPPGHMKVLAAAEASERDILQSIWAREWDATAESSGADEEAESS